MAYSGLSITIPMGKGGLHTDDAPMAIPPTALIDAQNVRIFRNAVEKDAGSAAFTMTTITSIPSGVMGALEFSRDLAPANRIIIMVGGDGYVYWMPNIGGVVTKIAHKHDGATAARRLWNAGANTPSNQACLVIGGGEVTSNDRKVFIFTGQDPVQVLKWRAASSEYTMQDITTPAVDWFTGGAWKGYPSAGLIVGNRLVAYGVKADAAGYALPSEIYASLTTDHEDFASAGIVLVAAFPGVGDSVVHCTVFKGLLIAFKYPFGIVGVDVTTNASSWSPALLSSTVGGASAHCGVQALDDYLFKNSTGSISSLVATNAFGDFTAGDVLVNLRVEDFIRDQTTLAGNDGCHALYYGEKKHVYFSYRSSVAAAGASQDLMVSFYMGAAQDTRTKAAGYYSGNTEGLLPAVLTKDAKLTCLFSYRDANNIARPAYGTTDGRVLKMDQPDINVGGSPYLGVFQTPHLDFGFADQKLVTRNKNFDFLEFRYETQGDYPVFIDTFIDGEYYETTSVVMTAEDLLADDTFDVRDFMLDDNNDADSSTLADDFMLTVRVPIHGMGKTISVRVYNTGLNQGFKISSITFSFKVSGEQQTK